MSQDYLKLDRHVLKWINKQGWSELREVQSKALDPILAGNTDVIISASTAAGKTEAFFLPAISAVLKEREQNTSQSGLDILYVSPLKALINDQYRRLEDLSEMTGVAVTAWHGDSSTSAKKNLRKSPTGIVLITPESLEAMLFNNIGWVAHAFKSIKYVVIDEFHAFIDTARGQHLISLLTRIDYITGRSDCPIPRVALSATLGDIDNTPVLLRPSQALPCAIVKESARAPNLKIIVKGFIKPDDRLIKPNNDEADIGDLHVCGDIYKYCRGKNTLVFANTRSNTESLSAILTDMCQADVVPHEFFPHHGSLSKAHREMLEQRLQKDQLCTTAICTMTLELGIDIGKVDAVIQVSTPPSVASLRQRLGRSGRRGGASRLRVLMVERHINENTELTDCLRLSLVQALAMIRLLLVEHWFEPPNEGVPHFSTLLHQILACIGQYGGIHARQLYEVLCKKGAFTNVTSKDFITLLKAMNDQDLITQLGDDQLTLGVAGEKIVSHYTFYAVFQTPEEYRVVYNNITIGTIPASSMIIKDQYIIFAGKRWRVRGVDAASMTIDVSMVKGGGKPPVLMGDMLPVHEKVSQEMLSIFLDGDYRVVSGDRQIDFIDETARGLFLEGVSTFEDMDIANNYLIVRDDNIFIFMWMGTVIANTLGVLLVAKGYSFENEHHALKIQSCDVEAIYNILKDIAGEELPSDYELAQQLPAKQVEKFDEFIPHELLDIGLAARIFDTKGLRRWFDKVGLNQ